MYDLIPNRHLKNPPIYGFIDPKIHNDSLRSDAAIPRTRFCSDKTVPQLPEFRMTHHSVPGKNLNYRRVTSNRIERMPESSTVAIADIAAERRRRGDSVVDMSAGRASEGTHQYICDAAVAAMAAGETHQTAARGIPDYLIACAAKLERENGLTLDPMSEVIATLGCKQGLLLALFAILDPGDEIIIEDPHFVSYTPVIELCGGAAVPVPAQPENGYRWTYSELTAAVTAKTRAILFCSPNNPLGIVHTLDDLEVIQRVATENNLTVISDEIYDASVWGERKHIPIASLPDMFKRTIGLMGMTKSYSMGGWRIGYAYADSRYISKMLVVQQHVATCANSIAQRAGVAALSPQGIEYMSPIWEDWEARCMYVADEINKIEPLSTQRPEGTFYAWVNISNAGLNSLAFAKLLLERKNVAVVPGQAFGTNVDGFIRLTCVRSWSELKDGLERIASFVASI